MNRLEITRRTARRHQRRMFFMLSIPCAVFIFIAASVRPQKKSYLKSYNEYINNGAKKDDEMDIKCPNHRPVVRRKAVLIFAVMRSGSSFLGELFNQHAEVYYLFEPLYAVGYGPDALRKRKELLHDLLHCNYTKVPEYYKDSQNDQWSRCTKNVCFAERSKFLWRNSDLCEKKYPYCGPSTLDPDLLARICRQSLFTAIKTIRISQLSNLEYILKDPGIDLRVIQLVRDPRAIVSSRMKYEAFQDDPETFVDNVISMCQHLHENFLYAEHCIFGDGKIKDNAGNVKEACDSSISKLWKGRFMRISHEYTSEKPFEAWRDVYEFAEVNFDPEVMGWIAIHTSENFSPKKESKNKKFPVNYFSTSKVSSEVLNAWRKELSFDTVQAIQETCGEVMTLLGYSELANYTEQLNMKKMLFDHLKAVKISWSKIEF